MSVQGPYPAVEIAKAVEIIMASLDYNAIEEFERVAIDGGVLLRCVGCGWNYPLEASGMDAYCETHYDDCGACQDGEAHPHWNEEN